MNWPAVHRIIRASEKRLCVLLHMFVVLLTVTPLIPAAQTAHADIGVCSLSTGCNPPPDFLNLNQSLYAATPTQVASLQNLQAMAIDNTIANHGLAATDTNAVKSWGRTDAEAELYAVLLQAINATSRTTDQQNAVDWLTAVAQREAELAAQDAGLEYVKWAGLDQSTYWSLVNNNRS
jgi:hypothetical protein